MATMTKESRPGAALKKERAERYEVEWCLEIPTDEAGDADHDAAVNKVAYFRSRESAEHLLKRVETIDAYGMPQMHRQVEVVEGHWETVESFTVANGHVLDGALRESFVEGLKA